MKHSAKETEVLNRLTQWANNQPLIRAMLLEYRYPSELDEGVTDYLQSILKQEMKSS